MPKLYETLRSGGHEWELYGQPDCEHCRLDARLRNRTAARAWLQQFKNDAGCMNELRRLLSRETDIPRPDKASDDDILNHAARLFEIGRWHVHGSGHGSGCDTQTRGSEGKAGSEAGGDTASTRQSGGRGGQSGQSSGAGRSALLSEPGPPKSTPPPSTAADKLTWIEIELIYSDGTPLSGVAYELKLPDGSVHPGKLDAMGRARHEQIPPGQCHVKFPELDAADWKRA